MDRRSFSIWAGAVGATIAVYFMLFFRIAAPGTSIVNDGLMNERTSGVMFGGFLCAIGVFLFVNSSSGSKTVVIQNPAPVPPQGFWMDVSAAMRYPTLSPSKGPGPLSTYKAQLRNTATLLTDAQAAWAWSHGVDPGLAGHYVGYVEAYRSWRLSAMRTDGDAAAPIKVGIGVVLLLVALNSLCSAKDNRPPAPLQPPDSGPVHAQPWRSGGL